MDPEYYKEEFRKERRARLAAERLLEQKQSQLKSANRKLSQHAISLSDQIVDQRKVLDKLQGENSQAAAQNLKANHKALAAERLLWDAVKSIHDGFALFDKDRKLIAANAPYLDLFRSAKNVGPGVSLESILDLCLEDNLIDRDGKSEDEWYDFMLDRLGESDIQPVTLKLHNGIYVKLVDRRTADGGIVSLALNITDTIKREEELLKARDTAMAADRAKSTFLAKMSHEFRTPINGVVGMADLLLEHAKDEDSQLYASTIKSSGNSLLSFVNNVLEYATIEADRLVVASKPFRFNDVVEGVKTSISPQDIPDGIEVVFEIDPKIPPQLTGDSGKIGQIVKNLYSNAIKNTQSGTAMVRAVWQQTETQANLVIAVEDTGIGIPEDKIDHIFGGFNQSDDSHSRGQDGAGLGLSIVQKLIDAMNGKLVITSIEGEGSQFEVSIPIPDAIWDAGSNTPTHSGPVLLVSKNPLTRAAMTRAFNINNLDFEEAERVPKIISKDVIAVFVDSDLQIEAFEQEQSQKVIALGNEQGNLNPPFRANDIKDLLRVEAPPADVQTSTEVIRVLAAEDNKTNQLVFRKMLKDLDIDLKMVSNGVEVVEAYKTFDPHLIFMDISMPLMGGMEATQQIRWHETETGMGHIPIVAMTAHAMEGDEARIRDCGLDHYMTKPLSKAAIVRMIEKTSAEKGFNREDQKAS